MITTKPTGIRVISCRDNKLWYSKLIGEVVPFVREDLLDPLVYISKEPAGYINIIYKSDSELIF